MGRLHGGWRPELLRQRRVAVGLTVEETVEQLRAVAVQAGLDGLRAADPWVLSRHEQGELYPDPHFRRGYCLVFRAAEPELGFRHPVSGARAGSAGGTGLLVGAGSATGAGVDRQRSAVERVLDHVTPVGGDCGDGFRQRVLHAWERRQAGAAAHRPALVLVGGYAGSGKTELARFVTRVTGWALLDKDPLTRPLVERLLAALGADVDDRHSSVYRNRVRPAEYACLTAAARSNIALGVSTVVCAPFVAEMGDPVWMGRLAAECAEHSADLFVLWVRCDVESMREFVAVRADPRDTWKLRHWEEYLHTVDLELRPVVPHLVVDNRFGVAVARADLVRGEVGTTSSAVER